MNSRKICFLVLLFAFSCNKPMFDYRKKFIGDFDFSVQYSTWNISGESFDTTYSYAGSIQNGDDEGKIVIYFSDGFATEANLYEDGTISVGNSIFNGLHGEFESVDIVNFQLKGSGLGGGSSYKVNGKRHE